MKIANFEDICSITALVRPGPQPQGGTTQFIKKRTGAEPVYHFHKMTEEATEALMALSFTKSR